MTLACEDVNLKLVEVVTVDENGALTTIWCRCRPRNLALKLDFCSEFEQNVWSRFSDWSLGENWNADVWLIFWSWSLIEIKMKFDQDLCKNLWYDLKKLLWFKWRTQPSGPLCLWQCFVLSVEDHTEMSKSNNVSVTMTRRWDPTVLRQLVELIVGTYSVKKKRNWFLEGMYENMFVKGFEKLIITLLKCHWCFVFWKWKGNNPNSWRRYVSKWLFLLSYISESSKSNSSKISPQNMQS